MDSRGCWAVSASSQATSTSSVQDPQAHAHGALRVVFMGFRIPEIDEQAIPQVLGDMSGKALDHADTGGLVGADDLPQILRIELSSETSRVDEVAEQHRELTPFRLGTIRRTVKGCLPCHLDLRAGPPYSFPTGRE